MARLRKILAELARRKVVRTTGAYVLLLWALAQGVAELFPVFGLPDWSVRVFVLVGIMGTPLVAFLAWRYDLTAHGIVRDFGIPNDPSDPDCAPGAVTQWALQHHNLAGTGCLCASWAGSDGVPQRRRFFEPIVIGREAYNDIQLPDPRVSRRHVVLWAENGTWWARDLKSSNGTYLDGNRVDTASLPAYCQMEFDRGGPIVELSVDSTETTLVSSDG